MKKNHKPKMTVGREIISVSLPLDLADELNLLYEQGYSRSAVIVIALREYFRRGGPANESKR